MSILTYRAGRRIRIWLQKNNPNILSFISHWTQLSITIALKKLRTSRKFTSWVPIQTQFLFRTFGLRETILSIHRRDIIFFSEADNHSMTNNSGGPKRKKYLCRWKSKWSIHVCPWWSVTTGRVDRPICELTIGNRLGMTPLTVPSSIKWLTWGKVSF